jgi:glycosyltransferase involved in cell wall biosynthesis
MNVTLLCADVAANALGRTLVLAELLQPVAQVRIVGASFGAGIWEPARLCSIPIDCVPGARWPRFASSFATLRNLVDGDVVIACKPLLSSYGVALSARRKRGIPIVLDIDDDDLSFRNSGGVRRLTSQTHPNGSISTRFFTRRTSLADAIVVATQGLQRRFGGTLIPHVRNTDVVRARPELAAAARERLGIGNERVVMFMGSPRPHKGIEDAAEAVRLLDDPHTVLMVVGMDDNPYTRSLRQNYPEVRYEPLFPLNDLPLLLQAADVVVVPQRDVPQARDQLPAKLLDGMAAEKPVITTSVSDMPSIVADGRGWLVPPSDPHAIAGALREVFADPQRAAAAGRRAREWVVANASYESARGTLMDVISAAIARRAPSR